MTALPYIIGFCSSASLLSAITVWALIRQGRDEQ